MNIENLKKELLELVDLLGDSSDREMRAILAFTKGYVDRTLENKKKRGNRNE